MNFNERLVAWMEESNIRQVDICTAGKGAFTKAYLSMVLSGKRSPNKELLECLSDMSQRSINWWLNGVEKYEYLSSLKNLIEFYYEKGLINKDGDPINKQVEGTLYTMLDKELHVFAEEKKAQKAIKTNKRDNKINKRNYSGEYLLTTEGNTGYLSPVAAHMDGLSEEEREVALGKMDEILKEYGKK